MSELLQLAFYLFFIICPFNSPLANADYASIHFGHNRDIRSYSQQFGSRQEDLIAPFPAANTQSNVGSGIVRATVMQRERGEEKEGHHRLGHHQSHSQHEQESPRAGEQRHHWGYDRQNGPHSWGKQCRHGTRQSPIDIRTSNLEFAFINELHFVNYDISDAVDLRNNGHSVVITGFEKWGARQRPYIYGGGLTGKYMLAQLHFHWATEHEDGSEHTLNALHYPVELHMVHVKDGHSLSDALGVSDGLAVIGIFYYIGDDGASMANLESGLKRVVEKDSATLIFNYTMGVHLPSSLDNFYRYHGSLTTPGCDEAVVWTLMAQPIPLLGQQLDLLRAIQGPAPGQPLGENVRPVQPLNGRRVQFRSSALNRQKICSSCGGGSPTTGGRENAALGTNMNMFAVLVLTMAILMLLPFI